METSFYGDDAGPPPMSDPRPVCVYCDRPFSLFNGWAGDPKPTYTEAEMAERLRCERAPDGRHHDLFSVRPLR